VYNKSWVQQKICQGYVHLMISLQHDDNVPEAEKY